MECYVVYPFVCLAYISILGVKLNVVCMFYLDLNIQDEMKRSLSVCQMN